MPRKRPNLLIIMLHSMSRMQFGRVLPRVGALLHRSQFVSFEKYAAVGKSSVDNEVALYLGEVLGTRSIASLENRSWLWDALRDVGYATFRAADGCAPNTKMADSIRSRTTHGTQLAELFCSKFVELNCVGDRYRWWRLNPDP